MLVDYSPQLCFLAWIFAHCRLSGVTALHGPAALSCARCLVIEAVCILHLSKIIFFKVLYLFIYLFLASLDPSTEFLTVASLRAWEAGESESNVEGGLGPSAGLVRGRYKLRARGTASGEKWSYSPPGKGMCSQN